MKKKSLLFIFLACLFSVYTFSQIKIGLVDANRAVLGTDEGKAAMKKINDWAKAQDEKIRALQQKLQTKKAQFAKQQNILSDSKKEELLKEIDNLSTKVKRAAEDAKRNYQMKLSDFGNKMDKKITPLFKQFAKEHGYTVILYLDPRTVAYYDPSVDITDEIIKLYNKTYPYGGAKTTK